MPQLTKGARKLLDDLAELVGAIRHHASECDLTDIKMNPLLVAEVFADIDRVAADLQRKLAQDLTPLLERRSSKTDTEELAERLAAVEAALAALQQQQGQPPAARAPIPLRRTGEG